MPGHCIQRRSEPDVQRLCGRECEHIEVYIFKYAKAGKNCKVGIKGKRKKCGWGHEYLIKVLECIVA